MPVPRRKILGVEDEILSPNWLEEAFGRGPDRGENHEQEPKEPNDKEKEYLDLLQRLKADFVNYKRRVEREREQEIKSADRDLILKLLPVTDDFRRALDSVPAEMAEDDWVKGMALIERKLMAMLEGEGLKRIDAEGKEFDPRDHEAVLCEEGSDHNVRVKAILRDGYRLHDRVIRPAQVIVSRRSEQGESIAS